VSNGSEKVGLGSPTGVNRSLFLSGPARTIYGVLGNYLWSIREGLMPSGT
jgi:hypothetical protein